MAVGGVCLIVGAAARTIHPFPSPRARTHPTSSPRMIYTTIIRPLVQDKRAMVERLEELRSKGLVNALAFSASRGFVLRWLAGNLPLLTEHRHFSCAPHTMCFACTRPQRGTRQGGIAPRGGKTGEEDR